MRTHGTLIKWNDDRGFGFIDPAGGGGEMFVHVSAFPRDGVRPRIGELISFDVDAGEDGKRKAVRVMRPGTARRPQQSVAMSHRNRRQISWVSVVGVLFLAGALAYVSIARQQAPSPVAKHASSPVVTRPSALAAPSVVPDQPFRCDGRTRCPQMRSCAEATFFLNHCPGVAMDGNHDGVPCERQWCRSSKQAWP